MQEAAVYFSVAHSCGVASLWACSVYLHQEERVRSLKRRPDDSLKSVRRSAVRIDVQRSVQN